MMFANEAQSVIADHSKIEAFMKNAEQIIAKDSNTIMQHINEMQMKQLPNTLCSEQDAYRLLFQNPGRAMMIFQSVLDDEVNGILEVLPKTVLALEGSNLLFRFRPVPANILSLNRQDGPPRLQRSKTIQSNPSIQDDDQDNQDDAMRRRQKKDLRLRKSPSDAPRR